MPALAIFRRGRASVPEHITDTGPLVGWINSRDQWHAWSASVLEGLAPPLITCEAVIAEAAWQLSRSRPAVDQLYGLVDAGALRVVDLLPEHMSHLRSLTAKYPQMDFCDAAVVRLAEIFPQAKVITTDSAHFTIYRRFGNKPLALIHPMSG
jgi:predicted nucleic acid-binding protein